MYNPTLVGEVSEGMVLAALLRARKVVLQPFGNNQRYDLVVEEDGRFLRIQCKTGRVKKNGSVLVFNACSTTSGENRDYRGQIELFGVYASDLDKVYLVPVDVVSRTEASLRLTPPSNNQLKGVRYASEFELLPVSEPASVVSQDTREKLRDSQKKRWEKSAPPP